MGRKEYHVKEKNCVLNQLLKKRSEFAVLTDYLPTETITQASDVSFRAILIETSFLVKFYANFMFFTPNTVGA